MRSAWAWSRWRHRWTFWMACLLVAAGAVGCGGAAVPRASSPANQPAETGHWSRVPETGTLNVTALAEGSHGTLSVGTGNQQGVLAYSRGKWSALGAELLPTGRTIRSITPVGTSAVLAATSQGVLEYGPSGWQELSGPTPPGPPGALAYGDIPAYSVTAVMLPHGHVTAGGYPPGNVSVNSASDGFGDVWQYLQGTWVPLGRLGHTPTSMLYTPARVLVVGTHQGVWTYTHAAGWHTLGSFPTPGVVVTALALSAGGRVLAGVQEFADTVARLYEYVDGHWVNRSSGWTQLPETPVVQALAVSHATGVIWVGTASEGVWMLNGSRWSRAGPAPSAIKNATIQAMDVTHAREVYVGTPNGLWRLIGAGSP